MVVSDFMDHPAVIEWMHDNRVTIRALADGSMVAVPANITARLDAAHRLRVMLHAQTGQQVPPEIDHLVSWIATGEIDP